MTTLGEFNFTKTDWHLLNLALKMIITTPYFQKKKYVYVLACCVVTGLCILQQWKDN